MSRLTFYDQSGYPCYRMKRYSPIHMSEVDAVISNSDVAQKLAELEDAEEQNRLITLPQHFMKLCENDGRELYAIVDGEVDEYTQLNISFDIAARIEIEAYATVFDCYEAEEKQVLEIIPLSEIGKTVFLTLEEAEAALSGRKEST